MDLIIYAIFRSLNENYPRKNHALRLFKQFAESG